MKAFRATIAFIFSFSAVPCWAAGGKYISTGVSYNIENMAISKYSFDNNSGFDAKFGYIANKNITFEGSISYTSFKNDGDFFDKDLSYVSKNNFPMFDVKTIVFDAKFSPDLHSLIFQPYAVIGAGIIISDPIKHTMSPSWDYSFSESVDEQDDRYVQSIRNLENNAICGEIGVGFDYYLADNVSLQFEIKYFRGFEDLNDVRYIKNNIGIAFHF